MARGGKERRVASSPPLHDDPGGTPRVFHYCGADDGRPLVLPSSLAGFGGAGRYGLAPSREVRSYRRPLRQARRGRRAGRAKPVDVNRASRSELKKLPGIGDAEPQRSSPAGPT